MLQVPPSINNFSQAPLPLVATAIPNNNAVRAPIDSVPPTVSNVQIENNARGNRNPIVKVPALPVAIATDTSVTPDPLPTAKTNPATFVGSTEFFAQLLAQDGSNTTRTYLAQYDKLVSFGLVKYKPSNARLPTSELSQRFNQILISENQPLNPLAETPKEFEVETVDDEALFLSTSDSEQFELPLDNALVESSAIAAKALNAYQSTIARNKDL